MFVASDRMTQTKDLMLSMALFIQVKLTGTHLGQQIYAMITYMQATQNVQDQSMVGKKAKDKKKANKAISAGKVCDLFFPSS